MRCEAGSEGAGHAPCASLMVATHSSQHMLGPNCKVLIAKQQGNTVQVLIAKQQGNAVQGARSHLADCDLDDEAGGAVGVVDVEHHVGTRCTGGGGEGAAE